MEFPSVFDNLGNDETQRRVSSLRALALADKRIENRFGMFLRGAKTEAEFEARLGLLQDDFTYAVESASTEVGYDRPEYIAKSIVDKYRLAAGKCSCCNGDDCSCCGGGCDGDCSCGSKKSKVEFRDTPEEDEEDEEKTASADGDVLEDDEETCPNCHGKGGDCEMCNGSGIIDKRKSSVRTADGKHWIQDAVKKPGELHKDLGVPQGEKIPEGKLEEAEHSDSKKVRERAQFAENMKGLHHGGVKQSNPFGPSLNPQVPGQPSGSASFPPGGYMQGGPAVTPPVPNPATAVDPQAGGNAEIAPGQGVNQTQAFPGGQGGQAFPGQMGPPQQQNMLPGQMPTGTFSKWQVVGFNPSDQGDNSNQQVSCPVCGGHGKSASNAPCSHCHGAGKVHNFGGSALDALDQSYSKVAWNVVAESGNTDLGGPEPKIDKAHQTDKNPKKEEESAVEDSGRWPTKRKDITDPIKAENREVGGHPNHTLKEIGEKTTESESLPSNSGDAGFTDGGVNKGPHTDTFGNDGQTDPVTNATL